MNHEHIRLASGCSRSLFFDLRGRHGLPSTSIPRP